MINGLDMNNIGAWPAKAKAGFCVVAAIFVFVILWLLVVSNKSTELADLRGSELSLRESFQKKQQMVANLVPLKDQLVVMEKELQKMLRQLPSKTQMPDLITDISQTSLSSGLVNELFQPGEEAKKEFYAEKPIAVRMIGSYHQFGAFMSGVSAFSGVVILTMHDINLVPYTGTPKPGQQTKDLLTLSGTIKTYRYLDDEETKTQDKSN